MCRYAVLLASLVACASGIAEASGLAFAPGDDGHVRSGSPDATFAHAPTLPVGADRSTGEVFRGFVRFRLPAREEIVSATLHARFAGAATSHGLGRQVISFVADDAWTPGTLSWASQPAATGESIAILEPISELSARTIALDVTSLARREQAADGVLSLRIAAEDESDRRSGAWRSRDDSYGAGFHLVLVVSPAPKLEIGDVVAISYGGLYEGVVAIDPDDGIQKALGPIRMMESMQGLASDPRDGSLLAQDADGVVRIDDAGDPSPVTSYLDPLVYPASSYLAASDDGILYTTAGLSEIGVERIELATGARSTLSTGGDLCSPRGVAVAGDALLVADRCGWLLRIARADGAQSRVPTAAVLHEPGGLAIEENGSVLLADGDDRGSGRILRIDPGDGSHAVVAVLPFEPGPIALAGDGALWVGSRLEREGAELGRVDLASGSYTALFRHDESLGGFTLGADGAPRLLLGFAGQMGRIVRIEPAAGSARTVAAPLSAPWPSSARHLVLDAGRQLVATTDLDVLRVDPATGRQALVAVREQFDCGRTVCTFIDLARGPAGRFGLLSMFVDPVRSIVSQTLHELDPANGHVERRDLPGDFWSAAIAIERDGALLAGLSRTPPAPSAIERLDLATGAQTVVASGGLLRRIDDLQRDRFGLLYVSDVSSRTVLRIDPSSGAQERIATGFSPDQMAIDPDGRVFGWETVHQERLGMHDPASGDTVILATRGELVLHGSLGLLAPRCSNGIDDDRDGAVDHPEDVSCPSPRANREASACGFGAELSLVSLWLGTAGRRVRRLRGAGLLRCVRDDHEES